MNHRISLISTIYNGAKYLDRAIDSVLAQTYENFEFLIWDDGSTDSSLEIAQRYAQKDSRIRVFSAPHQGRSAALQAAHAEATGDYLGWLDGDDILSPTALAETAKLLNTQPKVGMVYTDYQAMDAQGNLKRDGVRCQIPYSSERLLQDFMTFHFRLIRRSVFEAAGGIDTSIPVAMDYDLCLRLSEITEIHHLQKSLYYYRVHSHSISQSQRSQQIYWSSEAISRALERRGLANEWAIDVNVIHRPQGKLQGKFSIVRKHKRSIPRKTSSLLPSWVRRVGQALTVVNLSLAVSSNPVWAMPVPNADGTGTQVNVNGNQFDITGGSRSSDGQNLFHSFERFNLTEGQVANFLSQPEIQNILGRINGGDPSVINGLLQVSGGNSNLFLLNPSGIIFGNNATLDVPAAFNASTADGIQFNDGWFSATGLNTYSLLNGTPIGFSFSQAQPSAIVNAGILSVNAGQNVSLLGGTVVNTGQVNAPGGEVTISSIPGSSYVRLSQPGQLLSLEVLPITDSETQPNTGSLSTTSLPELLTGVVPTIANGVEITTDGSVILTGSDITVEAGDVAAKTVAAETAVVSAANNLSLIESQIQTSDALRLEAKNTVTVRDSVSNSVNIQSGDDLTIQGAQGIDISALNFLSNTPNFTSGGNLTLVSDGLISGDASFSSQQNIAFVDLERNPRDLTTQGQAILQSSGVVDLGNFSGASLRVEANGSIRAGNITITQPASSGVAESDPDFDTLTEFPALILRAGLTENSSIISVGDVTANSGVVKLSSNGNIFTDDIDVSSSSVGERGGTIELDAFNIFTGDLDASAPTPITVLPFGDDFGDGYGEESFDDAGNISIEAGSILRTGKIAANSISGNGGQVNILAADAIIGDIDVSGSTESLRTVFFGGAGQFSDSFTFRGGDVEITANAPLEVGSISVNGVQDGTVTLNEIELPEPELPPTPIEEIIPPTEDTTSPIAEDMDDPSPSEIEAPNSGDEGEPNLVNLEEMNVEMGEELLPPSNSSSEGDEPDAVPTPQENETLNLENEEDLANNEPETPPTVIVEGSLPPLNPSNEGDGAAPGATPQENNTLSSEVEGTLTNDELEEPTTEVSENPELAASEPNNETGEPVQLSDSQEPEMPSFQREESPTSDTTVNSVEESTGLVSDGDRELPPSLNGLDNFTLADEINSDSTEELINISEFDQNELKRVRKNRLNFLKAQRLAGKKMTAQEIASLLQIPLSVAELAVLLPVGEDVQVPLSEEEQFLEGDVLYAQDFVGDLPCKWYDLICWSAAALVGGGTATVVFVWVNGEKVLRVIGKNGKIILEKTGEEARELHKQFFASDSNSSENEDADRNTAQDKPLTKGDLDKLKEGTGLNGEQIKRDVVGKKNGAKYDLYKDRKGNVYVKPKGGKGPGEPTGYNLNDF